MTDQIARDRALNRFGIPPCLLVPIAAVNEQAITDYVGDVIQVLSGRGSRMAFLVRARPGPAIDARLPIWDHPGSGVFHAPLQVWVHEQYRRYRPAYRRAFPDEDLRGLVLSHALNRRVAALKGFGFVRLTATSRRANSSSAFSEQWGVALHSEDPQMKANRRLGALIEYADLTGLMLMLDMNLGGGVMDAVNEGFSLIRPRA